MKRKLPSRLPLTKAPAKKAKRCNESDETEKLKEQIKLLKQERVEMDENRNTEIEKVKRR